jgi:integrase
MAGKRGQNEGSIYKRPDGRWCAQVNLGYVNGKRKRKYLYGDTRAEVAKQMTTILRDVQQGIPVATERLTVAAFLDRWLEDYVKPSVRPSTYADYETTARLRLKPALGRIGLTRLTAQDVQKMMNEGIRAGMPVATIRHARLILGIALGRATKWQLVAINAASLVEAPRTEQSEVRPLTPEQTMKLLKSIRGDRLEALYTVAVAIGLRRGEALGLTWDCIDFDAATLTVRFQLQRIDKALVRVEPKTARSRRTVALPSVVVDALRRHKIRQLEERLLAGSRWQDSGYVFTTTIGTPLDGRSVTRFFADALTRAELPHVRFHDPRHGCATLLLMRGASLRAIMETLGHSQIAVTANIYAHVGETIKRETAAMMDAALSTESYKQSLNL